MTDTKPQTIERARKTPPPRRRGWWIWAFVALAIVAGAILAIVLLWPDGDDTAAPVPGEVTPSQTAEVPTTVLPATSVLGELTWSLVADVPAPFLAVAATPEGFLAAAPATAGGVDFWTSTDGAAWELLVSDQTAFAADEVVWQLSSGPSGFVAVATRVPEGEADVTSIWTSPDGEMWYRGDLSAGPDDPGTPYLQHWFDVMETVSGPNGFVAIGSSGLGLDIEAILADFAPEASTAHYMVGEGPTTIEIFTEDGTELVVTYTELGIAPEQRDAAQAGAPSFHLWRSGDGIVWESIDLTDIQAAQLEYAEEPTEGPPEEVFWIENLVGTEDGFYLFSGPRLGFSSTDGRTWTPFEMQGLPEEFGYGVSAIDGGLVLFGGEEAHGYFGGGPGEQSVWTSPDGRIWTETNLEVPLELGEGLELEVSDAIGGPAGILVQGGTMEPIDRIESVAVVKDGYIVMMGTESWTVADEATGELIGETGNGLEIGDSPTGAGTFPIVDSATGEELVVITEGDIVAAEEAVIDAADPGRAEPDGEPVEVLAFSTDGTTWATDAVTELFGDDASIFHVAVGADRAVALVLTDFEALMAYAFGEGEPPTVDVWVGELGG